MVIISWSGSTGYIDKRNKLDLICVWEKLKPKFWEERKDPLLDNLLYVGAFVAGKLFEAVNEYSVANS
jgi:hypothetical protein